MQSKRRYLQNFEAKSVMLFAACALTTLAAHAQTPNSTAQPQQSAPAGQATFGGGAAAPGAGAAQSSVEAAAFARADKDRDGKLSRSEAAQLPEVMQRFDQIDANRDGTLSREEFDKGTRS